MAFLPDYHGEHFHAALRRLLVTGSGPFVVHLSTTARCPWSCQYCFASAGGPDAVDPGDTDLDRVAAGLAERRVPMVILSGGEPLARFARVVRLAGILSRGCEVRLVTSGAGLTAERATALRDAGVRVVAVSLDSDDAMRVDAMRGRGASEVAHAAITASVNAGLFTLVTSVVGRATFTDEAAVDRFLRGIAARHPKAVVNFVPAFATGRGAREGFGSPAAFAPTGAMVARAVRAGGHRAGVFYAPPMDALVGCVGAAHRQLVLDARGELFACVSRASHGNVHREGLDVVWRRMLAAPSRYAQGYFCADVADRDLDGDALDPTATRAALEGFFARTPDALLQRVLDVAGPVLARVSREDGLP